MKNSETFDRSIDILLACGHKQPLGTYREDFLRHAGLALSESRKSGITARGGKTVETFSTRKVAEASGMLPTMAALFSGAWAMAHGEELAAKLLSTDKA